MQPGNDPKSKTRGKFAPIVLSFFAVGLGFYITQIAIIARRPCNHPNIQDLDKQTDVAARYDQLILIHTPHLDDKHKGTSIITSILKNDRRIKPERVLIDHCEEHTIRMARDNGFWAGLTIYPVTKVTPQRGADILEQFGPQMICVNSASDWGESGPTNLTDTCLEFLRRGHSEAEALKVFHDNPCLFFGQCPKWKIKPVLD